MKPQILPAAIEDLRLGREFYDQQEAGVGTYFLECVFAEIESLRLYAGIHNKRFGFHKVLVSKFPYVIYYLIEKQVPVVYRVLDCRSDPKKHRAALK